MNICGIDIHKSFLKRFYDRLRAKHKVALMAVAGKLAVRIWHICNDKKYMA